jgi:uncharacterized membrane protein
MFQMLAQLKDSALRPVRTMVSHLVTDVIEIALIVILAMIAAGFGIGALYIWFADRYGSLHAAGYMAAIFAGLAVLVVIIRMVTSAARKKKAERERQRLADQASRVAGSALDVTALLKTMGVGGTKDRMAAGLAQSITSRVSPWTLVGLSVLAGFVGGRVLDKD